MAFYKHEGETSKASFPHSLRRSLTVTTLALTPVVRTERKQALRYHSPSELVYLASSYYPSGALVSIATEREHVICPPHRPAVRSKETSVKGSPTPPSELDRDARQEDSHGTKESEVIVRALRAGIASASLFLACSPPSGELPSSPADMGKQTWKLRIWRNKQTNTLHECP